MTDLVPPDQAQEPERPARTASGAVPGVDPEGSPTGLPPTGTTGIRSASGPLSAWLACGALLALLALTAAVYWPGLSGPPLLDDEVVLQPLFGKLDPANWSQRAPALLFTATGPSGRPLAMASFLASLTAHGQDLRALKYENLMLHLLCGMVLLAWLLALQRGMAERSGRVPPGPWAPLFATGIWLVHPLLLSTVLYAVQRMTVLSTLFTLVGLLCYTVARNRAVRAPLDRVSPRLLLGLCFLLCLPLAVFSKENGALLVPLCAALEWTVFRGQGSLSERRLLRAVFGCFLVLPVLLGVTVLLPYFLHGFGAGFGNRGFTLGERLLTECRVLGYYLGEWLLPGTSNLSFFHDDFTVSRGLLDPITTLPALLLPPALIALALLMRSRLPLLALGVLVFLIGHSLEGTVVPLELVFEHRNYLSGLGIAVALAGLPWRRWLQQYLVILLGCALILGLGARTYVRATVWGTPWTLYTALYQANPDSPRLSAFFANNYANAGQFDKAREVLAGQHTLGAMLQRLDIDCLARTPITPAQLGATLAGMNGIIAPYETSQLVHLANDALGGTCGLPLDWTSSLMKRALNLKVTQGGSRQLLYYYSAQLDHAQGRGAQAQAELVEAAAADSANPLPLLLSAEWAIAAGDPGLARQRLAAARSTTGAARGDYDDLLESLGRRLTAGVPIAAPLVAPKPAPGAVRP